jgi:hypothetical protein
MRYQIYNGSQSRHCCFEYTVVDTTKPDMIGGKQYKDPSCAGGQYHYETICECFSHEDAVIVCKALNSVDQKRFDVDEPEFLETNYE